MKITKWKTIQSTSSIGLALLIATGIAMLCVILGPTTIGVKSDYSISNWNPLNPAGGMAGGLMIHGTTQFVGNWSQIGEALSATGMVLAGISWLAICVGWYFDPTKLDERITLTISASALLIGMVLAIAGVSYENHNTLDYDKGFLAGNLILILVPSLFSMLLMVEPLMLVYKPKKVANKQAKN